MPSVPPRKISRKQAVSESDICELVRSIRAEKNYTLAQIAEILRGVKKRAKGRPAKPDRFEILGAAAKAKAEKGKYRLVAPRYRLTAKQLSDLVQRNRVYFNRKLDEYRTQT
jgi:hypothetical protein